MELQLVLSSEDTVTLQPKQLLAKLVALSFDDKKPFLEPHLELLSGLLVDVRGTKHRVQGPCVGHGGVATVRRKTPSFLLRVIE